MKTQYVENSIVGWFFLKSEVDKAIADDLMMNPSIDLANPCNLNCAYCYIEEKESARKIRKPSELDYSEIIWTIDDLHSCGAKTINLVGAGEPTIDPRFESVVQHIFDLGMVTVLFTNGIRLYHEPSIVKFLYERNVSVVLKYNAISEETQDLVAGQRGYTRKRDKALERLIDAGFARTKPTRLGLDVIAFKGNVEEIPEIHRMCRAQNLYPIIGEYIPTGRTERGLFQGYNALNGFSEAERKHAADLMLPIDSHDRLILLRSTEAIDKRLGIDWPDHIAYFGGSVCTQVLGLYVDIQGDIWPCVAKQKKTESGYVSGWLGNIRRGDRPSEIWKGNSYLKQIRGEFSGSCPFKPPLLARAGGGTTFA